MIKLTCFIKLFGIFSFSIILFSKSIIFQLGRTSDAIKSCTDVLGIDGNDIEAYCDRGDAHLLEDNYDAAIKDFQAAKNINGDFQRVSLM